MIMFTGSIVSARITIHRSLRSVLAAQAILAAVLVVSEVPIRLPSWLSGDSARPSGPVTPGDQVWHYDPTRIPPDITDTVTPPEIDLSDELPSRLEFRLVDTGRFGEVVLINGPIETGDSRRFAGFLASLDKASYRFALNSPGGAVYEALEIGRRVREAAADTLMLPGTACLSACPYILAGGVRREVSVFSAVGMHQHYYETPGYVPAFFAVEDIQHGQGQTMEYLIGMGIDPGLMVYSLNTPPDEIYMLAANELLDSRLATEIFD